jgi:hypothetical protein
VYDGNDDEVVTISGVRPDQFGQVFIDLTLKSGSFAYLNAMQVTATADVSVPEPSAMVLAGAGALAIGWLRVRRRVG